MMPEAAPFTLLVSSVAAKTPLLRELRKALNRVSSTGRIIGGDLNPDCPGRYFVDEFWQMPATENWQIDTIIADCQKRDIRVIIPTRDGELGFFSQFRDHFRAAKISVMISTHEAVETCRDKLAFAQAVHQLIPQATIPTVTEISQLPCSDENGDKGYVVKERWGSGSQGLLFSTDRGQAANGAHRLKNPIFQPWLKGTEYSIDVYLDQKGAAKGALVRSRDLIIAGEAQITTSLHNPQIEALCCALAEDLGLTGHVIFQGMFDRQDNFRLLECNPRFGGASTLALAAGLDSFYWFLLEVQGKDLGTVPFIRSSKNLRQIRFANDKIIEIED